MCGAFGGNMSGPNRNNAKGMFENARIRDQILKPYLREQGLDAMGQYPLPDISKIPIHNNWRERVERIITKEGYKNGPWMYKGAKACLTWPIWHNAFPDAKWVIVRRRTGDIVASCLKTNFMRAFSQEQFRKAVMANTELDGWIWWVHQHEKRFEEMIKVGLNCMIVWPERMVIGDYDQAEELISWLGLDWQEKEVKDFIDPKLWKAKRNKQFNINQKTPLTKGKSWRKIMHRKSREKRQQKKQKNINCATKNYIILLNSREGRFALNSLKSEKNKLRDNKNITSGIDKKRINAR